MTHIKKALKGKKNGKSDSEFLMPPKGFYEHFRENPIIKMQEILQPLLFDLSESNIEEVYQNIIKNGFVDMTFRSNLYVEILIAATKRIKTQFSFAELLYKLYSQFPSEIHVLDMFDNRFKYNNIYGADRFKQILISKFSKIDKNQFDKWVKQRNLIVMEKLINDDVDFLQKMSSEPEFNLNVEIFHGHLIKSFGDDSLDLPTIFDFSCYVGAVKCAKFLYMNFHPEARSQYSLCGGNGEIIRFLEQEKCLKLDENSLCYVISHSHYDIYDWIRENLLFLIDDSRYVDVAIMYNWEYAINELSFESIQNLFSNYLSDPNPIIDVISKINLDFYLFISNCLENSHELSSLIESYNFDVNQYAFDEKDCAITTLLYESCKQNNSEAIISLLSIPEVLVGSSLHPSIPTPLQGAISFCEKDIISLFLDRPPITIKLSLLEQAIRCHNLSALKLLYDKIEIDKESLNNLVNSAIQYISGNCLAYLINEKDVPLESIDFAGLSIKRKKLLTIALADCPQMHLLPIESKRELFYSFLDDRDDLMIEMMLNANWIEFYTELNALYECLFKFRSTMEQKERIKYFKLFEVQEPPSIDIS